MFDKPTNFFYYIEQNIYYNILTRVKDAVSWIWMALWTRTGWRMRRTAPWSCHRPPFGSTTRMT